MEKETKKECRLERLTGKCHHWKESKQLPSPKLIKKEAEVQRKEGT